MIFPGLKLDATVREHLFLAFLGIGGIINLYIRINYMEATLQERT